MLSFAVEACIFNRSSLEIAENSLEITSNFNCSGRVYGILRTCEGAMDRPIRRRKPCNHDHTQSKK